VVKGLWFQAATGEGPVGVKQPPGRVGGQVAFPGSHLVDSSGHKLTQAHEGLRVQSGGVEVVPCSREEAGPLIEKGFPYSFLQGGVCVVHQRLSGEGEGRRKKV